MGEFSVTSKKACTKCGEVKWASDFYNLAASPDGRCPRCKECEKARARGWHKGNKARANDRAKKWKAANKGAVSDYNKKYHRENADKRAADYRRWASRNKESRGAYMRDWYAKNPDKHSEYNQRRAQSAAHRISNAVRCRIWSGVKRKSGNTFDVLGYSIQDLMMHLEARFLPGMTWQNYGEWHIDHIRPLCSFDFESTQDASFKKAWSLDNLQPLWAEDNLVKGGKWQQEVPSEGDDGI